MSYQAELEGLITDMCMSLGIDLGDDDEGWLSPADCAQEIKDRWAEVERAYSLLAESCNLRASQGIRFEETEGYEALVALREALGVKR